MELSCQYLGLQLRHPLVASASPMAGGLDGVRRLADAGLAAIVLPSLFEEELRREAAQNAAAWETGIDSFGESLSYFPDIDGLDANPCRYLSLVERAVAAVDVPVIASLNAVTVSGWTGYASELERAGAAAIELNIYHLPSHPPPTSPSSFISGREVEQHHIEILSAVKAAVSIPVAVKLSPYYSSMGEMALRLDRAGADGLVLFNRFLHPDIDPERLAATEGFGLSSPAEGRLPRTWIAHLAGRVKASLAASGGVEAAGDVAAYLLPGGGGGALRGGGRGGGSPPPPAAAAPGGLCDGAAGRADQLDGPEGVHQPGRGPWPARQLRPGWGRPGTGRLRQVDAGGRPGRAGLVTRSVPGGRCRCGGRCPGGFRRLGRCV